MNLYKIIFLAILINNAVLTQFLGIRPLINESGKSSFLSTFSMGIILMIVMIFAVSIDHFIQNYLLIPYQIEFLRTISFVLVILILSQFISFSLKKIWTKSAEEIEKSISLTYTSSLVLGVCLLAFKNEISFSLAQSIVYAFSAAAGYLLMLIILTGIEEQLKLSGIPKAMKGIPISLIILGLLSLAFIGLTGIVK